MEWLEEGTFSLFVPAGLVRKEEWWVTHEGSDDVVAEARASGGATWRKILELTSGRHDLAISTGAAAACLGQWRTCWLATTAGLPKRCLGKYDINVAQMGSRTAPYSVAAAREVSLPSNLDRMGRLNQGKCHNTISDDLISTSKPWRPSGTSRPSPEPVYKTRPDRRKPCHHHTEINTEIETWTTVARMSWTASP